MFPVALQFDMRAPDHGAPASELYKAALDQSEWGDKLGFAQVILMEHHASDDGYLPSPLVMGAAVAGRTKKITISMSVILAPFYDPIRLAEDIAVLDLVSQGRVRLIFGAGYRREEFHIFGRELKERPRLMEQAVVICKKAWTGEPFEYRGKMVRVLPRPFQKGGPGITMGGASPASAKRAARIADDYLPIADTLYQIYLEELKAIGKPQPARPRGKSSGVMFIHVSEDPERDWPRVAPYVLHDMNEYGKWSIDLPNAVFKEVKSLEELRASGLYKIFTPEECVAYAKTWGSLAFKPLCGGLPPALAWESLKLVEQKVLPQLG